MAFDVYPITHTNPLLVAAGVTSAAQPLTERESVGASPTLPSAHAMIIRVAMINPASACLPPVPNPTFFLSGAGGASVALPVYPVFAAINGASGYLGDATVHVETNGVFRVEVLLETTGSAWQLQIRNNHATDAREFTWVVADNQADTAQPWLEIPHELDLDDVFAPDKLLTGQIWDVVLSVINKGTGTLTLNDVPGPLGGSAFEILSLPGTIDPGHCGDVSIRFHAPLSASVSNHSFTLACDDTTATVGNPAASHNQRVDLSGSAGKLEVVMVLDASGSMAFQPDGSAPGVAVSDMRWGHMVAAAKQFLALLEVFAGNLGRIGIVVFPDTTLGPVPNPHNVPNGAILRSSIPIPADVTSIQTLLDDATLTPDAGHGNTCLGFGIGLAMGTAAGSFGQFLSSASDLEHNLRWLVVMSDGAHNLGPPAPTAFYGAAGVPMSFRAKRIKVIAVSYGDPGALNWPPDPLQMETLRTESDGVYVDAGPNDLGMDPLGDLGLNVFKSFRMAITDGLALDPTVDPGHLLRASAPEFRRDVSVLPYDKKIAFVVNWRTFDRQRVNVQILAPDCQLITPQVAQAHPNIDYHDHERYTIYTFNEAYLRNSAGAGKPRDGTWTLIVSSDALNGGDTEPLEYEVITQSRLRLRLTLGQPKYYAGDTVALAAQLTLDAKPIHNASVTLTLTRPGASFNNWFSQIKISTDEFAKAARSLGSVEQTRKTIKAHAISQKGLSFNGFNNVNTVTLIDSGDGVYRASIGGTTVPGTYNLHVTAVGETEDGVAFRREQRLQLYLDVRPLPQFTLFDLVYVARAVDDRPGLIAQVRVWPRDAHGNVWLIDSETDPGITLTATGAEFTGALVDNLDGSYSREIRYPVGTRPTLSLKLAASDVVLRYETAPLADLEYASQVVDFRHGTEAKQGANRHADPLAALGDVTAKGQNSFVSLGARGSITLAVRGQVITARGGDDITVFVRPDEELRPYSVEALASGGGNDWRVLGRSPGTTQSFSLVSSGLNATAAIRIADTSGRVRDSRFEPSATPGVSVAGVGFRKSALSSPVPEETGCLRHLRDFVKCLLRRHESVR